MEKIMIYWPRPSNPERVLVTEEPEGCWAIVKVSKDSPYFHSAYIKDGQRHVYKIDLYEDVPEVWEAIECLKKSVLFIYPNNRF